MNKCWIPVYRWFTPVFLVLVAGCFKNPIPPNVNDLICRNKQGCPTGYECKILPGQSTGSCCKDGICPANKDASRTDLVSADLQESFDGKVDDAANKGDVTSPIRDVTADEVVTTGGSGGSGGTGGLGGTVASGGSTSLGTPDARGDTEGPTDSRNTQDVPACQPKSRVCSSGNDNDCNGKPDNQEVEFCACTVGEEQPCQEHPGKDGKGICVAGKQTCELSTDKTTSFWSKTCKGSVGPTTEACDPEKQDENCDGQANEGCECTVGSGNCCKSTCGPCEKCNSTGDCETTCAAGEKCDNNSCVKCGTVGIACCGTSCSDGSRCVTGNCKFNQGEICSGAGQCATGNCVGGYCCSQSSCGPCETCKSGSCVTLCATGQVCPNGTCVLPTKSNGSSCTASSECQNGSTCMQSGNQKLCCPSTCTQSECRPGGCDQQGACLVTTKKTCNGIYVAECKIGGTLENTACPYGCWDGVCRPNVDGTIGVPGSVTCNGKKCTSGLWCIEDVGGGYPDCRSEGSGYTGRKFQCDAVTDCNSNEICCWTNPGDDSGTDCRSKTTCAAGDSDFDYRQWIVCDPKDTNYCLSIDATTTCTLMLNNIFVCRH